MLFEQFLGGHFGLHGGQFVAFGFEAGYDVADDSALDSVGFDHDVAALEGHGEGGGGGGGYSGSDGGSVEGGGCECTGGSEDCEEGCKSLHGDGWIVILIIIIIMIMIMIMMGKKDSFD